MDMTGKRTIIAPDSIVGSLWTRIWNGLEPLWIYVATIELIGEDIATFMATGNVISFEIGGDNPIEREEREELED